MPTDLDCNDMQTGLKDVHKHLRELREDLSDNSKALQDHLDEYQQDRIEHHRQHTDFMTAITAATTATNQLAERLYGILNAWEAMIGAIKVGATVGQFVKWLAIVSVVGAGITYFINHLLPHVV